MEMLRLGAGWPCTCVADVKPKFNFMSGARGNDDAWFVDHLTVAETTLRRDSRRGSRSSAGPEYSSS